MSSVARGQRTERRSLRFLLSAYAVSQFGNWLFRTGVVYYAYNQSHGSTATLATAIILVYVPILLGSRLLAPLADRGDTRRTLIGLDVLRAVVLVALLAVVGGGAGSTSTATVGVMGFLSLLTPLFTAAQTAYLRRTLSAERIPQALAAVSRIDWSMFILGTAAGPLILQAADLPVLIGLDIITFVVSGLLLIGLTPAPTPAGALRSPGADGTARPGLTAASRLLLAGVFALNAGAGLINVYPNVVARDYLGSGAAWLSAINLANGVGALTGATLAGRLAKRRGLRPGVLAAFVVALSLAGMAFMAHVWVALLASSVMLLGGQVFAVAFQSRILENEPVDVAGRVSGLFTLATFAGVAVSVGAFLGVTTAGSVRGTFPALLAAAALAALGSALIGGAALRRYGDKVHPDEDEDEDEGKGKDKDETEPVPEERRATAGEVKGIDQPDPEAAALLLRQAGRSFATGVTVTSTVVDGTPHATTLNSFATVSLDPALVMVSVRRGSRLDSLIAEGSPLGITVLAERQRGVAVHFAGGDRPSGAELFEGHPWEPGAHTGAPLLAGGSAWIECVVQSVVAAGDHSVVLARLVSFTASEEGNTAPLVFHGGDFTTLSGPALPAFAAQAGSREPDHGH
ncbi:MFS transporter [Streptomyces sp. NPDC038707]|uniref:MFS transporter n=1 Tax=Streptomyces sp. NPDC038707 TaxID=3154329 RepID=UPI00340D41E9